MKSLVIVGAGGAGREALQVARRAGVWDVLGFADDAPALAGRQIDGVPVLGLIAVAISSYRNTSVSFHCAIGNNSTRQKVALTLECAGLQAAVLIDPTAVISPSATIGGGCYIGAQSFVGPNACLGKQVLINVGASIGHDSCLGDFSQACPGARVSGNAALGEGAFMGSNAVVTPGISVGAWATVAAASLAARDVPARTTAIGVPAKILAPPSAT